LFLAIRAIANSKYRNKYGWLNKNITNSPFRKPLTKKFSLLYLN